MIYVGKSKALILTCCNSIANSEYNHHLRLKKKSLKKKTKKPSILLQCDNVVFLFGHTHQVSYFSILIFSSTKN